MKIVVSAPPAIDTGSFVAGLAKQHGVTAVVDPARALCDAYSFQTLYEMPDDLQAACRLKLIEDHLEALKARGTVVFDHSVFPWVADWMRWFWGKTTSERWEEVEALIKECVGLYSEVHHVSGGPLHGYNGYTWLDRRNNAQILDLLGLLHTQYAVGDRLKVHAL